jgi:glutamate dehydrogenase
MPCGGRPSTLNINNYMDYMPEGKLSSRAIVEGGNSFITPDARIKLQDAGLPIVKDASANKCGVITSSYEIMSGLLLDTAEFRQEKEEIVKELMNKLAKLARGEADWLFAMHNATGKYLTDLTEELSRTINAKNAEIAEYFTANPEMLDEKVILAHLPKVLAEKYADRLNRLPQSYRVAIASVELATRIVYNQSNALKSEISAAMAEI